ncbi:MAG: deoxynucleoside kinase, partial [Cetobacterium sp.]|uniref:deoxynucleoside kinase n=1 Tax=Cetobacterium sp. TaxID=2071632 RepID=UPI003EE4712F
STVLPVIRDSLVKLTNKPWEILVEPVDSDPEFHRLLKQFIENPTDANKRAEFQNYMTESRANMLNGIPDGNYILERSLFSDLVFTHTNMLSTSCPTGEYWNAYWEISRRLEDYPKPDVLVYLSRNPYSCYLSACHRDREGEDGYDPEYFIDLHRFHLACLPQSTRKYNIPYIEHECGVKYPDGVEVAKKVLEHVR